jgi:hypothetical protein
VEHRHKKKVNKIGNAVFFITGHAPHEACSAQSCDEDLAAWTIFRSHYTSNNNISNTTLL